jgi:hypothetical protein
MGLLAGRKIHPEMAASWARQWDLEALPPGAIRWGVEALMRSVSRLTPSEYLFGGGDYVAWHKEFVRMLQGDAHN